MKPLSLFVLCVYLAGCHSGPYTILHSLEGEKTVRYGPYFENDRIRVGEAVLIHAVISLGRERLPKDFAPERDIDYSGGQVEAVLEFYFTNLTGQLVELKIEDLQCRLFSGSIGPAVMAIPPKQWVKSTPLVSLTSNYVTGPWDYSMNVVINGKVYPIKDKLVRMTIEQLKARHG